MSYINSASRPPEEEGMPQCFICAYIAEANDAENLVVARGAHSFVLMNRYPYSTGHLMIAPYRHTADFTALLPEEYGEIFSFAQTAVTALGTCMKPEGYNIGLNLGRVAGAGLDTHIHMHIVPRWNGDTNFMSVTAETKVLPQALSETYNQLLEVWPTTKQS